MDSLLPYIRFISSIKWIRCYLDLGLAYSTESTEKAKITLTNGICLCYSFISFIFALPLYLFNINSLFLVSGILTVVFFLIPIVGHLIKKDQFSKVTLLVVSNIACLAYTLAVDIKINVFLVYLPASILPFVLLNFEQTKELKIWSLINSLVFFSSYFTKHVQDHLAKNILLFE